MRNAFLVSVLLVVMLSGCARNRLPKPEGLPSIVEHNYSITAKNSEGKAVEGVRFHLAKADLATKLTEDELERVYETVTTNSNGVAGVTVRTKLTRHIKGEYDEAENEAELARQKFPHGGKDIWGYFSEIRGDGIFATKFSSGLNGREAFAVDVLVETPSSHGKPAEHSYFFQTIGISGKPVSGVRVGLTAADFSRTMGDRQKIKSAEKTFDCFTNEQGLCSVKVPVDFASYYPYDFPANSLAKPFEWLYKSNLLNLHFGYFSGGSVSAALPGFFDSSALEVGRATYSGAEPAGTTLTIVVPQPSDYFCSALKESGSENFAKSLDSWVRAIRVTSWAQKSDLNAVCREMYKGRQHVSLSLAHGVKYNELKLNNYGIGILVFDEVVRKVLRPLAAASTTLPVDGLKVSVQTLKSNFIEKASPAEFLKFDFYMPKNLVSKYNDADISGQTLINGSIVLLNDERIDLELR